MTLDTPASPESNPHTGNSLVGSKAYFSRKLTISGADLITDHVDEDALVALDGCKVILGEPGMGKSELMGELGRRLNVTPVTATRFMNAKDPAKVVPAGKTLLIDGLDEAMARREADALDAILAQLEAAGSPDFILSCRSREWQARGTSNLRQIYGADPIICTLESLTQQDALRFLGSRYPTIDPEYVLDHLEQHSLSDLYCNPLTLSLMGRVAKSDKKLPATRADLFERVCTLIWPEHDEDRQDLGLSQITEDDALDAAGAICASLLLSGAEAADRAGVAGMQAGDLRLADIEKLPQAGAARVIFSSKLFHNIGLSRAKPIHRVIAEFLGARWLARQVTTPRARRRLLAQFHGSSGVPASLRGLHAWLAYHSAAMAEVVISADAYGVLRYGEPSALTPHLADKLFDALCIVAEDDPYFRAEDWDKRTATALMVPALSAKINAIVASPASSGQLRSLLIEGLNGTKLAGELANTLETVMLSHDRFYREREDAAEALSPYRTGPWWQTTIARLSEQGDLNSTRLAQTLIERAGDDVPTFLLISTIFARMGVTICPVPRQVTTRTHTIRHFDRLLTMIKTDFLVEALDLVTEYARLLGNSDWQAANEVASIVAHLIVRSFDEGVISVGLCPALWRWLEAVERARRFDGDLKDSLDQRLGLHLSLRQAVQAHALEQARGIDNVWITEIKLRRRLVGMSVRTEDIVRAFNHLATGDLKNVTFRKEWCDLVQLAWGTDGLEKTILAAAERFRRGDKQLAAFLLRLENPKKQPWEARQEREAEKRAKKQRIDFAMQRRYFGLIRDNLRAGVLGSILQPAQAYFGLFSNLPHEVPPFERIAEWLGPDLRDDVLIGFEAVLYRNDLPSGDEIADSLAKGMDYNVCFPIMAGLFERLRLGKGIGDVPPALQMVGLLLCYNDSGWVIKGELAALQEALETVVVPTQQDREIFARMWIEPALAQGSEHIHGLYRLANYTEWQATGAALAKDWLTKYPNVPKAIEASLVDCLARTGAIVALEEVAAIRAEKVFADFEHMLTWLAIDVLVRFEAARPHLGGIGNNNPEFVWFLRDRCAFEKHAGLISPPIAQAVWIVSEFRGNWPQARLEGSSWGNTNPHDAADFLRALISRIAEDTSLVASQALQILIAAPHDSYTELVRHMAAEQRQKRAEEGFAPLTPTDLLELLADGAPTNIEDLKSLVQEELDIAQRKLFGEDIDQVRDFWTDGGIPREENRCRDRLAAMIGPELARYQILRITEADMPMTKRVDLAYAFSNLQLPMEIKGQWHKNVWDAASGQLDIQYLVDWRAEQRGIYCVLWFGDLPRHSGRRLKGHPDRVAAPANADEMRDMLIERVPQARRALIEIVVLDLSAGKP